MPPFLATAVFVLALADAKPRLDEPLDDLEEPPRFADLDDDLVDDDFFEALFLEALLDDELLEESPLLLLFEAAFLVAPFLDALLFLAAPFLEELLFLEAPPFFEAVTFFAAPPFLLAAAFLLAPFLEDPLGEPPRPEDEPPRLDDFLDAPFLDAPVEDLPPPEDLLPPFFPAADFLVDFAIVNGF